MATVDVRKNTTTSTGFPSIEYLKKTGIISVVVDISKVTSIKGSLLSGLDVLQLIQLPAGVIAWGGTCEILTAFNNQTSMDVGYVSGPTTSINAFCEGGTCNTTGFMAAGTGGSLTRAFVMSSTGGVIGVRLAATTASLVVGTFRVDVHISQAATANDSARDK